MAATNAAKQRKIRQDALREQISKRCTVQQVIDNIKKLEEQGASMEAQEVQAVKYATDSRLKLLNKYIPDPKSVLTPINFDLPESATPIQTANAIMKSVADGVMPPDIGVMLIQAAKHSIDIDMATEVKERLARIEEAMGLNV